jgi:hypothetical protein
MRTITITATVDENHRLVVDLPDIPPGPVEITIKPVENGTPIEDLEPGTREWARAKLKAAGLLAEDEDFPELEGFEELSDDEEERLAQIASGGPSILDLVNQDREERF